MPAATIIVPLDEGAPSCEQALRAAAAQTSDDYEVVVVDGSRDGQGARTAAACAADGRIRTIAAPVGCAPSLLRNIGVEAAAGPVIAICTDASCWPETRLSQHIRHIMSDRRVGVSASPSPPPASVSPSRAAYATPRALSAAELIALGDAVSEERYAFRRGAIDAAAAPAVDAAGAREVFRSRFRGAASLDLAMRIALTPPWKVEIAPGAAVAPPHRPRGLELRSQVEALAELRRVIDAAASAAPDLARDFERRYRRRWARLSIKCVQAGEMALAFALMRSDRTGGAPPEPAQAKIA